MIVLDEQLLGLGPEQRVAEWYRGSVCFIIDLRPGTIIKDDAVGELLRRQRRPLFVTINVRHFWRRDLADPRFCIACFPIQDTDAQAIPPFLQRLVRLPDFRTKRRRAGHIFRIYLDGTGQFYRHNALERHDFLL